MSDRIQCHCPRCTIRGLRNPAVIITVGVLFLLQETRGGYFDFSRTFPVILVVIGAILLASSLAPTDGHVSPAPTAPPAPGPTPGAPQNTFRGQGQ